MEQQELKVKITYKRPKFAAALNQDDIELLIRASIKGEVILEELVGMWDGDDVEITIPFRFRFDVPPPKQEEPEKPKIKARLRVEDVYEGAGQIVFWASSKDAHALAEFGAVKIHGGIGERRWLLIVDGRFDFDEVLEYVKSMEWWC